MGIPTLRIGEQVRVSLRGRATEGTNGYRGSEAAALHREGIGPLIVRSVIWGNQLEYEITEQDADGSWRTRRICKLANSTTCR